MNCNTVHPLLYRLSEDRLLDDDASDIRDHLDHCDDCTKRFQEIAAIDESSRNAETEYPSANLRPQLLAAYRRSIATRHAEPSIWNRTVQPKVNRAATVRERTSEKLAPKCRVAPRTEPSGMRRYAVLRSLPTLRRAAVFALVAFGAGAATWLGVHPRDGATNLQTQARNAPVTLEHVFPLLLRTTYTVKRDDGVMEQGVDIQYIQ